MRIAPYPQGTYPRRGCKPGLPLMGHVPSAGYPRPSGDLRRLTLHWRHLRCDTKGVLARPERPDGLYQGSREGPVVDWTLICGCRGQRGIPPSAPQGARDPQRPRRALATSHLTSSIYGLHMVSPYCMHTYGIHALPDVEGTLHTPLT